MELHTRSVYYLEDGSHADGRHIGLRHGQEATVQVGRCMEFYAGLFQDMANMTWPKVQQLAMTFEPVMRRKWPAYLEEMTGGYGPSLSMNC